MGTLFVLGSGLSPRHRVIGKYLGGSPCPSYRDITMPGGLRHHPTPPPQKKRLKNLNYIQHHIRLKCVRKRKVLVNVIFYLGNKVTQQKKVVVQYLIYICHTKTYRSILHISKENGART